MTISNISIVTSEGLGRLVEKIVWIWQIMKFNTRDNFTFLFAES